MTQSIVLPLGAVKPVASIGLWALVLTFGSAVEGAGGREPPQAQAGVPPFPVVIRVDAAKTIGEMRPVWRFFGYDEPNYTYMKDGQKLLGQLRALSSQPVYIRAHNLVDFRRRSACAQVGLDGRLHRG